MSYLERLREAVNAELDSGRLGTAVFARLYVALSADHGHLIAAAASAVELCSDFLNARVERLFAVGGPASGHVSVQVDFAGGQSALVASAAPGSTPWFDLFVLATRGSLRHAPAAEILSRELAGEEIAPLGESETAAALEALVEKSLAAAGPVRLEGAPEDDRARGERR